MKYKQNIPYCRNISKTDSKFTERDKFDSRNTKYIADHFYYKLIDFVHV